MRVLGVDPGYERLGIAVVDKKRQKESLVYSTCLKTPKEENFTKRLNSISKEVGKIIKDFKPDTLAIENLFFNKNQKTAMRVAEVRGAIINMALSKKLEVFEFTPLQIKIAVTGYGKSSKNQVAFMIKNLIKIDKNIKMDDEFDAIAVCLAFFASEKTRRLQERV